MIAEITALATCVGSITGLVKSLRTGPSDAQWKDNITALADNIIDLQTKVLAVQADYQNISEINQRLKQQIEAHEQWESTASRYKLNEIATGMFAYTIKPECQSDEPSHWLCPNCFQKKQKSILTRVGVDYINYKCHNCTLDLCPESSYD